MSGPAGRPRFGRPLLLWLSPLCLAGGMTYFLLSVSPARASINIFAPTPSPTLENLWAYADLPKPVRPTQTALPLATALPPPTETPAVVAMQILDDASSQAVIPGDAPGGMGTGGGKYILVDISDQHMYVYEGDLLLYSFVASTGINNSTRTGTFAVQSKIPSAYGSTWNIWMPSWLGIYWSGGLENGIHALPILPNGATLWEGFLGRPVSYGCVVLSTYEAQLLYDWADIGTPVEIQW